MIHEHKPRYLGYRLNPRRDYNHPKTIKEYVYKCAECPMILTAPLDEPYNPQTAKWEFRKLASEVFGVEHKYDLKELPGKKQERGQMQL